MATVDWSRSSGHPVVAAADTSHLATRRRLSRSTGLGREPPPRFRPIDRRGVGIHGMTLGKQGEMKGNGQIQGLDLSRPNVPS